jgi:CHAT domain-containing protein/Tfp pilus assembly protein PilF
MARAFLLALPCICLLLSGHASPLAQQQAAAPVRLEPGTPIERALSGSDVHRYELSLKQGTRASLSIEQRHVDVTIQVAAPDQTVLAHFNDELRDGMAERVDIVADRDGSYVVTIKANYPRVAAGQYAIQGVEIRDATSDDRTRQEISKLRANYLAVIDRDDHRAARPVVERALAFAESARGADDLEVARVRLDLGRTLIGVRDHANALPAFERSAAVFEKVLGADHPLTAASWTAIAMAYNGIGQRPKAEPLAQRALAASEKALGPDHPQVALCLITLGGLRGSAGDLVLAEQLQRRALAIVERVLGDQRQKEVLLNNLGLLLVSQQRLDEGEKLLRESLVLQEKLGTDGVIMATTLTNLGIVARQRKDFAQAEAYYLRALAYREQGLAPTHPDIAMNLNNLANVYKSKGDTAKSLETHLRAYSIMEQSAGPYGANTVLSLGNIARTYAALGDVPRAIEFQRRVDTAIERQIALNLAIGSERQKLVYVNGLSDRTERTISLDVDTRFVEKDATELAALVVLQRKGRVLDAMTDTFASVRRRLGSPADQQLLDQLATATTELARLALSDPQNANPADRLASISRLERHKEKLESDLSERSVEFRAHSTPLTLSVIRSAIPDDAALLEFAVYRTFDPKAEGNDTAYGATRYVAYVVTRGAVRGIDLGPAKTIDTAVEALRRSLGDPQSSDVMQRGRQLDALVMQPLRGVLGATRHLLVSPDGPLNLIPFEVLRDEQNRYAIERHAITYLSSGRDLVRMQAHHASQSEALVVADPAFGEAPGETDTRTASPAATRRSITSVDELSSAYFARLGGTALEAQQIKSLFPEATVLTRERATKVALRQMQAPRMLHIATHGFFIQDPQRKIANPLLRSGLAFSGANLRSAGGSDASDGILTALEASNLNLWGTKLVTLSACDTGVGEIKNGEGLYGLRRAFVLAGAESLVMSLWPVSDYATRTLMTDYYSGLKQGLGRGEALRQSKLAMLARKGREHPFYWAGFIQAGEWASLDGRR